MSNSVELSCIHVSCLDVVSTYDVRDPTAASPELRKRASSSIQSCLLQVSSSSRHNSLDGLRIGIPQVVTPPSPCLLISPCRNL